MALICIVQAYVIVLELASLCIEKNNFASFLPLSIDIFNGCA